MISVDKGAAEFNPLFDVVFLYSCARIIVLSFVEGVFAIENMKSKLFSVL